MNRKGLIFLPDGMADEPLEELGGLTPLEYARTPNMDEIARRGASGTFLTLPDGLPTSADVANRSVLGFDPVRNYPGGGPIEASAQGIVLGPDDVAWRCNLVYVDSNGILRDYSAGHIKADKAKQLMEDLQARFGSDKVTFHTGVSYRNLLVLHGKEFSPRISYHKPDSSQDIPVSELRLKADIPEAQHTVDFLEDLGAKCAEFLINHPLNKECDSPADAIWPWSPGRSPRLPAFGKLYQGRTGAIISAVDVIKGLGRCGGLDVVEVPGATGFLDTNYEGKAAAAIAAIETHDFVYLHLEAIDECSHLGDLKLKLRAIEEFDSRIVGPVMKALEGRDVNFGILPDHPVPIKLRCHTTTPVPLAVCGPCVTPDAVGTFGERSALKGSLGHLGGTALVRRLLELD
ncbi:MAG: cofactor-independent phosphoglycerate mutase [Victivallaceae bacterium]|nr:cofactor-independent phosphoglycerate mutase [Victivallaceae bacterium]